MELTPSHFKMIKDLLPLQRGNVKIANLQVINAILYIAEHGCKWRGLPRRFGNWHSIYTRANRWAKQGVLDTVFSALQKSDIIDIQVEHISIDSTAVKVHPDGTGALKKRSTIYWQITSRMDNQNSHGGSRRSNSRDILSIAWSGRRCARGQRATENP